MKIRYLLTCLAVGLLTGLGGMVLSCLLHAIQHMAYGYSLSHVISEESFLQGSLAASPKRRLIVLISCGAIAGIGWGALRHFGRPLVPIPKAVAADKPIMPVLKTVLHVLLQIITVALGSPLGREVAPRELGSLIGERLAFWGKLSEEQRRIVVACGAGAGLASVYNVPLSGALFALEALLMTWSRPIIIVALLTSALAARIAWIALGNSIVYHVPPWPIDNALLFLAFVMGPVFGLIANNFSFWAQKISASKLKDNRWLALVAIGAFSIIGLISMYYPEVLGNGKGPVSLAFNDSLTASTAGQLFILKIVALFLALWAGAYGGLLTPGISLGALFAVVIGHVWNLWLPPISIGAFAIIGGAAFLASSMKMPITAMMLVLEFARPSHDFLIPMLLSVAGSVAVSYSLDKRRHIRQTANVISCLG
ncbi:MAG: chloride channel protein [Zymomonas mobilis subsp. pomaceae]|uniref:chloride channel protein n=1 Tax=Zymomonas mobilis TaxID=542 RepID=UPI0039E7715E